MPMLSNTVYTLDTLETGNKRIVIRTSEQSMEQGRYQLGVSEWLRHSFTSGKTWYWVRGICPYLAAEALGRDEILEGVELI